MSSELDPAPKRTRESASKVRTGCTTCKARRVKCDEAKPICRRCAIGSRKCEYNTFRGGDTRRNIITVYLPPTQSQPVFFANTQGLDFFHHKLATQLDGQSDSTFWSRLVLQLAHTEPSIRHAVSAISFGYQDVELSLRHPAGYVKANPEAQKEWSKAVRSLSTRIQAHPNSNLVPLVCSLLFTCIELFRGNVESSLLHVQNGFSILDALRRTNNAVSSPRSNSSFNDHEAIEDHIVPMFSRLTILCSLAGKKTPPIYAHTAKEDSPHQDLADSRRRLFNLSDPCIRFIGNSIPKADLFQIDVDDLAEQVKLQARLDAWRDQLDQLLERMQATGETAKQVAVNLLLVHYKILFIWMRVCTTAEEMVTDSYHADFEELVNYAEQSFKSDAGISSPQPLSFDIKIVGPLYYTVLKCRHPTIRRRALELLQLAPRREGLWNAHHAYVTAKRVIELEERNLKGDELPDEASRLHGLTLPDEESRIYNPSELPFDFQSFDHSIVVSPNYPATLEAVFYTRPRGLLGETQMVTEYIKP